MGSLTLEQTFSGQDPEIIQYKLYAIFAAIAAVSETLRRIGWAHHPAWAVFVILIGSQYFCISNSPFPRWLRHN
jgi:hypothetical protein